jgi:hypothetical protein
VITKRRRKKLTVIFAGLDGEMTGTDPQRHSLIQIGLALSEKEVFSSRIGWVDFEYEPEALEAIKIHPSDICDEPLINMVDAALVKWIRDRDIQKGTVVPIGWGVSNFDRPFIPQKPASLQ